MREDVLIILNEREPLKQQKATELYERLLSLGHCTERIRPCAEIAHIIKERTPRVVVLDYLLGDYGTALDVLQSLQGQNAKEHIDAVLWTDELSVNVAVTAMKLGAQDYIETGSPRSIERVLAAIEETLRKHRRNEMPGGRVRIKPNEQLIYQAPLSRPCITLAQSAARNNAGCVVMLGDHGSGRSALARHLHRQRNKPGSLIEIEYDVWPGELYEIFEDTKRRGIVPLLSHGASVVLEHAEFDSGDLLEAGTAALKKLNANQKVGIRPPLLLVGTRSRETALAWVRLTDATLIEIPALAERAEDMLPLLQRFLTDLPAAAKLHELELSPDLIATLTRMDWPGNIRELRFVIAEAVATPLSLVTAEFDEPQESMSEQKRRRLQSALAQAIVVAKDRWERFHQAQDYIPPALRARTAIDDAGGNLRIAAVKLGTTVPQLKRALSGQYE